MACVFSICFVSHRLGFWLNSLQFKLSLSLTCAVSFPLSLYASMEAEGVDDYSGDCFLNRCASICAVAGDDRSYLLGSLFFGFTL